MTADRKDSRLLFDLDSRKTRAPKKHNRKLSGGSFFPKKTEAKDQSEKDAKTDDPKDG